MKCICVGRNYADHARELGNAVPTATEAPLLFLKPETALLKPGADMLLPEHSNDVHYELELVIRIAKPFKHVEAPFIHKYLDSLSLGLDFTARDVQQRCKELGHPWEIAKAWDGSAALGELRPIAQFADLQDLHFRLDVNGETRQRGFTGDMITPIYELIAYISTLFTLKSGDLIFTGTPAGVGQIHAGDVLEGFLGKPESEERLLRVAVR